jgi:putative protein kinase ArgK-like GTPase of G3E family
VTRRALLAALPLLSPRLRPQQRRRGPRSVELEQLRRAQQLAGRSQGQVVAIVGETGVGKSRLVHEFVHSYRYYPVPMEIVRVPPKQT